MPWVLLKSGSIAWCLFQELYLDTNKAISSLKISMLCFYKMFAGPFQHFWNIEVCYGVTNACVWNVRDMNTYLTPWGFLSIWRSGYCTKKTWGRGVCSSGRWVYGCCLHSLAWRNCSGKCSSTHGAENGPLPSAFMVFWSKTISYIPPQSPYISNFLIAQWSYHRGHLSWALQLSILGEKSFVWTMTFWIP